MTKDSIRTEIRHKRKQIDEDIIQEASKAITEKTLQLDFFNEAWSVFLYAAFKDEIQTKYLHLAARNKGKKVAYPKIEVSSGKMDFYHVDDTDELQLNQFKSMHIQEPNPKIHPKAIPLPGDIVIVPGLAFDLMGNRIGYGGGFYDRYLEKYAEVYKVGICLDFQIFETIKAESFDVKVDYILSEKRSYLPFL